MKTISLKGNPREITRKSETKAMRRGNQIPCVIYGQGVQNVHFSVYDRDLLQIMNTPNAYIIELNIEGKVYNAVYHAAQFHPVTDEPLHVDFLAVNETKPVVISVPVIVTGNSEGVRQGGKLILNTRKLKISAKMSDLPDSITVDVTNLSIGKSISAGDVKVDNVQILTPKTTIICAVKMTRAAIGAAAAAAAGK
ncbi:MAG: 50S ribosomal protein L25 [Bacteroidales bacterium]